MRWHDLAFLHWPVAPALLRPLVPSGLTLETFDGAAWIGVVPFRMSGVRPRLAPALPGLSAFPEINLRTYVTAADKPGVWFFSLDVTRRLAVSAARRFFHLPYFRARMQVRRDLGRVEYAHRRVHPGGPAVEFEATYSPDGEIELSRPGSLAAWLTERYCLYARDPRGGLHRGEVHHAPWPLQPARVEIRSNTFAETLGLDGFEGEPLAHFAADLEVVAWTLDPL